MSARSSSMHVRDKVDVVDESMDHCKFCEDPGYNMLITVFWQSHVAIRAFS